MTTVPRETMCLVLIAEGSPVPEALRETLDQRGWRFGVRFDPIMLMAELCLRERMERARESWDLSDANETVLVFADVRPAELLAALTRYLPRVAMHAYRHGRLEPAGRQQVDTTAAATPSPPPIPIPIPAGVAPAAARPGPFESGIAGKVESHFADRSEAEDRNGEADTREPHAPADTENQRVTAQEMEMLLESRDDA